MDKKDIGNDFLSINEFAEIAGMTQDALRHYEKKGIFHPARYGEKHKNEYRFYSPTQITTVKVIRVLAEIGVPLQTIAELAKERTPVTLMKLLRKHKSIVADEINFLQGVYSVINTLMELLTEGVCATETDVYVAELPEKRIILGGANDFGGSASYYGEFTRFCVEPHEPKLNLSFPVGGYFDSMAAFLNEPSRPTRFFSLDPKGNDRQPEGLYLIGYNRGDYGETGDLPKRMETFAKKNGLVFNGAVYNVYLFDELSKTDANRYLLQSTASVKETRRVPSRRPVRRV